MRLNQSRAKMVVIQWKIGTQIGGYGIEKGMQNPESHDIAI
jgi:hypothetical protein